MSVARLVFGMYSPVIQNLEITPRPQIQEVVWVLAACIYLPMVGVQGRGTSFLGRQ